MRYTYSLCGLIFIMYITRQYIIKYVFKTQKRKLVTRAVTSGGSRWAHAAPPRFFGNRKEAEHDNIILKLDVCKQTQKIKRHYFWSVSSTIAQSIFHFFGPGKKCHSFLKKLEIDQAIGLLIFWVCLQKSDFNATSLFLKFLTALLVTLEMIHLLSKKTKNASRSH